METAWNLARALLIGLLLLILLLRVFEDRFIFFPEPSRPSDLTPAQAGVEVEDVFITTSDAVRIHAWWATGENATRTVLYFHGNAGNLSLRLPNIGWLQQLPANVLAVDYRGYGKSEGKPTEEGVYRDAEAAYDYLVGERKIPPEQIVVLGQSLGSAVAVDVASKRRVSALILEGGFPSAGRVAQQAMGLPGLGWIIRARFDSAAKLKDIPVPVLVAHCRRDPVIPFALGEELYAATNDPKQFVAYDDNCHEPLYPADPEDYAARLRAFLGLATQTQRHEE
ncbi:MAG TPA: alpha/beta hydrolase [Candidatus Xenobia bacterium]|nr:alpha/beta hydrolase [Candidatus Xenobia bacterium]